MELIQQQAIQQLMEEENINRNNTNNSNNKENRTSSSSRSFIAVDDDDEEEQRRLLLLLARLLSQLDTLRADEKLEQPQTSFDAKEGETLNKMGAGSCGIDGEEIVRELNKVKRQNFITHCLLSVGILVTVGWQLSIVSHFQS